MGATGPAIIEREWTAEVRSRWSRGPFAGFQSVAEPEISLFENQVASRSVQLFLRVVSL
jgi:hypothetical protein